MSPQIDTIDDMKRKIKQLDSLVLWLESKAHDEVTWSYRRIYLEILEKMGRKQND